jgi:hypothetical protein
MVGIPKPYTGTSVFNFFDKTKFSCYILSVFFHLLIYIQKESGKISFQLLVFENYFLLLTFNGLVTPVI